MHSFREKWINGKAWGEFEYEIQTGEIGLEEPDKRWIVTLYFDAPIVALWYKIREARFDCNLFKL